MRKTQLRTVILLVLVMVLLGWIALYAHPVPTPFAAKLSYIKDERTKACFALYEPGASQRNSQYDPYFTYVPCELVDKADWQYYERHQ
jgi:hypothetical protein